MAHLTKAQITKAASLIKEIEQLERQRIKVVTGKKLVLVEPLEPDRYALGYDLRYQVIVEVPKATAVEIVEKMLDGKKKELEAIQSVPAEPFKAPEPVLGEEIPAWHLRVVRALETWVNDRL